VALPVGLDQLVLDHPVELGVERHRVVLEADHDVLPHRQRLLLLRVELVAGGVPQGPVEVLPLDVER
jgi:hypothetical protein